MRRPVNWGRYHCDGVYCTECSTNPIDCNSAFEAGADALLDSLIAKGTYIDKVDYRTSGWVVFIEE